MKPKRIINIRKLFLRFLKEHGTTPIKKEIKRMRLTPKLHESAYKAALKALKPNNDFWKNSENFIDNIFNYDGTRFIRHAEQVYANKRFKTVTYQTENGLETKEIDTYDPSYHRLIRDELIPDFTLYMKIEPYRKELHEKFIMFLKKHGAYQLYINCVAPYFIQCDKRNIYQGQHHERICRIKYPQLFYYTHFNRTSEIINSYE